MYTFIRRIGAAMLLAGCWAGAGAATPTAPAPDSSTPSAAAVAALDDRARLGAFVDGLVRPLMKDHNSPSGVVAIARGGELILAKGYGYADVEAQTPVVAERTPARLGVEAGYLGCSHAARGAGAAESRYRRQRISRDLQHS